MKRNILWTVLGATLLVATITVAWAQTQGWRGVRGHWLMHRGPMGFVSRELDLSENKKAQIKTIVQGERPNVAVLVRELAAEQKEMDALTLQEGARDDAKMQDITARQGATLAKLLAEKQRIISKIYTQVLDPAQRVKANGLLKRLDSHLDRVADRIGSGGR